MADGFEPYHVPQQSRRDKLRISNNLLGCDALIPLYDPSLISADLMNCADLHRQSFNLGSQTGAGVTVKEARMNLMGFVGGVNMITAAASSSLSTSHSHMFVDPQLSVQLNPTTVEDINGSPYGFTTPNNCRVILDKSFQGNEVVTSGGQSLSLSLSSHCNNNNPPLQRYDSAMFNNSNKVNNGVGYFFTGNGTCSSTTQLTKNSVPLGPFTGYASVLKGSRFLKPAHQLLEELCDAGRGFFADKSTVESSLLDPPLESLNGIEVEDDSSVHCSDDRKKSRLLSMLDEVYKRYKQYYQQIQAVFTSFESVAGLGSAAPFVNLAVKAMWKHFRSLKNAITDQLHFVSKSPGKTNCQKGEIQRMESYGKGILGQRSFHIDQPVWRPQRGLPERAVTVLRAWLFDHFLHPYPTDTDKLMLAKQTGLSRNQVSNWFINARVRLWKPMVEEIHMLETRQSQKVSQREDFPPIRISDTLPTSCSIENETATISIQRHGDISWKRTRKDLAEGEGPISIPPFNKLSHHPQSGIGGSNIGGGGGGGGGVSLTLGLHQNGIGLSESYPITAARRFGLDVQGVGYKIGAFGQILPEFQEN